MKSFFYTTISVCLILVDVDAKNIISSHTPKFREIAGTLPDIEKVPKFRETSGLPEVTEVPPHSYPWQVLMTIDDSYTCGGSLISPDTILTAAHCIYGGENALITLGAHNFSMFEPSRIEVPSQNFIIHPGYSPSELNNDLALIKLSVSINFNDFIKPVQLNEETTSNEFIGQLATLTGWTLKSETVSPYVLKKADVMVLKNEGCLVHDGPGQICVEAICGGDGGAPLHIDHIQIGIPLAGNSMGCELEIPEIYTDVYFYKDWIQLHL